jgi:class 3 adenylate cyclase/tetratricopeptide (TPR) repeat protein
VNAVDDGLQADRAGTCRLGGARRQRVLCEEVLSLDYDPAPIDTSEVTLSEPLLELTELLARNVHELWARLRLDGGWRYGPERNDGLKQHPGLRPYEALPEEEKQVDRHVAMEAIKAIVALGYRIEPPWEADGAVLAASASGADAATALLQRLEGAAALDLASLLAIWQARNREAWARAPQLYRRLGERMLALGEPLVGYDVVTEGLSHWRGDIRLRQLQSFALANSGDLETAKDRLEELRREGRRDEETLGMLAKVYKRFGLLTTDAREREARLRAAAAAYLEAYRETGGSWTGINAATVALLVGEKEQARELARRVHSQCLLELESVTQSGADPYWALATLGEAALVLEEWPEAEDWYARAADAGRGQFGRLSSTRQQARLVMERLGRVSERIERCLRVPRVVTFTGHMIDAPGRMSPRFPPELEPMVREAIRERLEKVDAGMGYSSAACGSDILFLEEILQRGGEAHVVLPYNKSDFRRDSVEGVGGAGWGDRFERVLERTTRFLEASEHQVEGGSVAYDYANLLLHGLASIRAGQLETELVPMAVWDGQPGDGPGGTASIVKRWRKLGLQVEVIDLRAIRQRESSPTISGHRKGGTWGRQRRSPPEFPMQIMAMLFADVVKSSQITEAEIPCFVQHFLGMQAGLLAASPHAPVVKYTWGDGLYLVFSSVRAAGLFALDLCDMVSRTNWIERGLKRNLELRIALHVGPVYKCKDPVTGRINYTGTHVRRAARIEPITPPNQVYASQAMAALAAAQGVPDFACDYVGQTSLAKDYGSFVLYHLRRSG